MRSESWSAARQVIRRASLTWLTLVSLYTAGIGTSWAQSPGTFTPAGTMTVARGSHTATLLADGKVLIAGGRVHGHQDYRGTVVASAELYDPSTGTFTPTGSMTIPRVWHTAIRLPNGKVLIVGGNSAPGDDRTAELYDATTRTFTRTADTLSVQFGATATLLTSGRVLIAGGITPSTGSSVQVSTPELFDPSTGRFVQTGTFVGPGDGFYVKGGPNSPAVTLLSDGRVLFAAQPFSEVYDPVNGAFSETGAMKTTCGPVYGPPNYIGGRTATLLASGTVLVTGGGHEDCGRFAEAEQYEPASGTFTLVAPMTRRRTFHTATALPDGTVLIAGGESESGFSLITEATAEIYVPSTGRFAVVGSMQGGRETHTATLLQDGRVLLAGGVFYQDVGIFLGSLASADLYTPGQTGAPSQVFPLDGAVTEDLRPRLQVRNVPAAGFPGTLTYRFDWSDRSDFGPSSRTSGEDGVRQGDGSDTAHEIREDLDSNTWYYWRARATLTSPDGKAVNSPYSELRTFRTPSRGSERQTALAGSHGNGNAGQTAMTQLQSARLAPSHVAAAASGSGVVLTWIAPPGQPPVRYAISGGTAVHESNLPVVVTPDASTQYTIPALPPGTYHFTVSAITGDSLSSPSNEAAVVVGGSGLASPAPSGAHADADGPRVTATWTPAPLAGTLYQVEIGEGPGLASAVLTTIEPNVTYRPDAPSHYFRVRAVRGAMVSAPSNEVFVSVAPSTCTAQPPPPILLPVSTTDGETTTSWLPGSGPLATHYRVDGLGPAGRMTLASDRSGTSMTATVGPGEYTIRVIAINACGQSAGSNSVSFRRPVRDRQ